MEKDLKDLNDRMIRVEERIDHLVSIIEKHDHAKSLVELELLKQKVEHLGEILAYLKSDVKELKSAERKHSESYTADKAGVSGWIKGFLFIATSCGVIFTIVELYKLFKS